MTVANMAGSAKCCCDEDGDPCPGCTDCERCCDPSYSGTMIVDMGAAAFSTILCVTDRCSQLAGEFTSPIESGSPCVWLYEQSSPVILGCTDGRHIDVCEDCTATSKIRSQLLYDSEAEECYWLITISWTYLSPGNGYYELINIRYRTPAADGTFNGCDTEERTLELDTSFANYTAGCAGTAPATITIRKS
jgi:hypothetical protein